MKDFFKVMGVVSGIVVLVYILSRIFSSGPVQYGEPASLVYYTSPTQATSSVGIYSPVNILANSGSRQYADICNTSPTSTNDLVLEFDATTSATGLNAAGVIVPGNSCYEMTASKMFLGNLYGLFTTNTATIQTLVK